MTERGKYIVIEGHDGTGKSTQVDLLREKLAADGIESIAFHEPEGTPIANEIRTIIKNGDLARDPETNLLLFTASRHEIWQQARAALMSGKWVVTARNYYSTMAYQGYGEGLDLDLITNTTKQFTDDRYIHPDIAIILSLEDEITRAQRIDQRGELTNPDTFESRDAAFQRSVKDGYLAIAHTYDLPVIAADQPIDTISTQIYALVK
jgi:dTMP kinase